MKKSLFVLVLLLAVTMASAAFADTRFGKQGTWALGGGGDINYETESETTNITLAPSISYFLMDNLTVGGNISINRSSGDAGGVDFSGMDWGVAALVRYHLGLMGTMFLTAGAHVGYYGTSVSAGDNDASASGLGFGAHVGPTLCFGGKFGGYFGAYLRYNSKDYEDEGIAVVHKPIGVITELGIFF